MDTQWHPAASIFPMLPDDKLLELAEDIEKNGQHEPVLLLDGKVLDGRNRMCACKLKGIAPVTKVVTGIDDPVAYVLSLNLHRRHLTPSQASMCAARARELYEQQAKERMTSGVNQHSPVENLPQGTSSARDAAGKAFGVSGKSVDYAKRVIDKGIPELAKAVDEGRMAVSTAAVWASDTADEQKSALEKQRNRDYSKLKPKTIDAKEPRHAGEHKQGEVFAKSTADVAITQLKGIPDTNEFREAAFVRVEKWINTTRKAGAK